MTSVNTNAAALTALRNLQNTVSNLETTQNRISTGLRIGEAKDNAAYWAISTTLKSDNKSLATVKDALGLGSATVDVAYQGLTKAKDVLDEIKSKLTAATQNGVDRNVIQAEIKELQNQLKSIANSSVFSGENWLSVDSSRVDFSNTKQVVASFARAADNSVSIGTVKVDISNVSLYDSSTVNGAGGILNGAVNLKDSATGLDLTVGGKTVSTGNTSTAGLTAAAGTATGTVNTAAVTGASTVAGAAATATTVGQGTSTAAALDTATATFGGGSDMAAGDHVTFGIKLNGAAAVTADIASLSAATIGGLVSDLQTAINATSLNGKVTVTNNGGKIHFAATDGTVGASSSIELSAVTNVTNSGKTSSIVPVAQSNGTDTKGNFTTGVLDNTKFAAGDVVTLKYKADGGAEQTVTKTLAAGDVDTAAHLASALAGITGLTGGVTASVSTTTSVKFESAAGSTHSVQLTDMIVTGSDGTIKNVDVTTGLTESKASKATTGDVQTNYGTNFAATDKINFNLSVDGATLDPVSVAAGANVTALVANLNANTTFNTKAVASLDTTNNKLVITSKTSGATSAVTVNSVSFADSTGAAKTVANSGFTNVATVASASTAAFTSPITLDKDDNLTFSIQVNDATAAKTITINQALVNKTLSTASAPVTNGRISTADDYKKVIDAALSAQNITGVTTKNVSNQIVFSTTTAGTAATLNISNVAASQGGSTITVDTLDISAAGFAATGVTTDAQIKQVLQAYISVVNQAITKVTTAASNLGSVSSRIDMQKSFVNTLMDTIDKGVSNLVDADMTEESTKLQALQVKQQLGTQALSIANQSAQGLLSLFRS